MRNSFVMVADESVAPRFTVVINMLLGGRGLERCLRALLAQQAPAPIEIVVPVCPGIDDIAEIRRAFPEVRFVAVDHLPPTADVSDPRLAHLIYCRRRAVGLAAARGEVVALTEDQVVPDPGWCSAMAEAHLGPHAAVGGAVENARGDALHSALHLFDFGFYQKPFAAGDATRLTDQNVSYKRNALEKVREVWQSLYHESAVHDSLRTSGEKLWITPDCVVRFDRGALKFGQQLRERFAWGRVFGGERAQRVSPLRRAALLVLAPFVPALIVATRTSEALRRRHPPRRVARIFPALAIMACCWAAGEALGGFTGRPFPRNAQAGESA